MNEKYRTEYCGKISESMVGSEVTLSGWIENIRDHGGVLFLDMRDSSLIISNDILGLA